MPKRAVFGACFLCLVCLLAAFAPLISPGDPTATSLDRASQAPSFRHPFGTDDLGGDVLSRCLYGARVSLLVGFLVAVITTVLGVAIGLVSGYWGGILDNILMRCVDIFNSLPNIVVYIVLLAYFKPGLANVVLVLALTGWTATARVIRSETLSLREREFVLAARALGASRGYLIFFHILPNVVAPMLVAATFSVAHAILAESTLSFLGLGIPPHEPSWGNIIMEEMDDLMAGVWWTVFFPGLALISTVLAVNSLGEGLKEMLEAGRGARNV
ncbi:MAG: ABC transporter permease [Firmicutes bacterium]|nr:ABC transporter permease [Bacillota bacterium]